MRLSMPTAGPIWGQSTYVCATLASGARSRSFKVSAEPSAEARLNGFRWRCWGRGRRGRGRRNRARQRLGRDHVLLGDMGGTSFRHGHHSWPRHRHREERCHRTPADWAHLVDVVSVGAGGGSIVTVSDRGVPQVGPESARSTPGPACYGRGGEAATVTDALVAMGLIDATNYLGGRIALNRTGRRPRSPRRSVTGSDGRLSTRVPSCMTSLSRTWQMPCAR